MSTKMVVALAVPQILLLMSSLSTAAQTSSSERPTPETLFHVGNGVTAPRVTYQPDPEYSERARLAHREGTCILEFVVGADGKVRDIRVVQSLGMGLDEKSVEALQAWKFEPGLKDGKPVAVQIKVEVSFHLGGTGNDPRLKEWLEQLKTMPSPYPPVVTKVEPCPSMSSSRNGEPERPKIVVAELTFENISYLSAEEQDQIAASLKQRTYTGTAEDVASEISERAKAAWQDRGYFKANVTADPKTLTSNPISKRVALSVRVNEGKQYRLGQITFKNNKALSNVQALRDLFLIKDGDIFSRGEVAQGLDALRKAYGEYGYINFMSVPDTKLDDTNGVVSIEVDVDEGKQFYISGITILGSDEHVIQTASKELPFQPGAIYNERLVELSLLRYASLLNPAHDPNTHLLKLDEQAGTVALTFDLRQCPVE